MVAILCPYCHKHSHVTVRWGEVHSNGERTRVAVSCDFCSRLSIGEGSGGNPSPRGDEIELHASSRQIEKATHIQWLPTAADAPEVVDVPEAIGRAAREAYSSASVGNHMASILMARTVIEATAKAQGISNGDLSKKINTMKDNQLIRRAVADQAHEVRYAGNDMAHGDIDVVPDAIDSEEILALMASVLTEVFQDPARLERIRAKRESR
ncbi:DUF4145 domain-containing protein [Frigoribacterium sp. VKM Ac-2836]|uniref:DUF4145 domain-containing protein n=1 Tax=Frigoribacterium sp. VKM Ac-2836 TaxID=2739014 RepID=UPI00156452EB|nr:DUF4145 domain-containing protein [Frigoribacterium sp. VKM Ac-2836]NRD26757.1 DUF4145 domain-containing protein [Frigoribacterium sp. VKM Ac-2836]